MHNFFIHRSAEQTILCCTQCGLSYHLIGPDETLDHPVWERIQFVEVPYHLGDYEHDSTPPCTTTQALDKTDDR